MPELKLPKKPVENWEHVRDEWVRTVGQLVADVEAWCREKDWPTRRIDKRMEESRIGEYIAPALLIQVDLVKLILEPVARFVPGADGVVDLYLMPEYDDLASIYHRNGQWQIQYSVTDDSPPSPDEKEPAGVLATNLIKPLTAVEFAEVIRQMI